LFFAQRLEHELDALAVFQQNREKRLRVAKLTFRGHRDVPEIGNRGRRRCCFWGAGIRQEPLIVKKEMSVSYGQSVSGMWNVGNTYPVPVDSLDAESFYFSDFHLRREFPVKRASVDGADSVSFP
jgi:hypothetical protein